MHSTHQSYEESQVHCGKSLQTFIYAEDLIIIWFISRAEQRNQSELKTEDMISLNYSYHFPSYHCLYVSYYSKYVCIMYIVAPKDGTSFDC